MSALRRSSPPLDDTAPRRPSLGLADAASAPASNPVLQHQARIATAFAEESAESYPGVVKLAIVLGAPLAMWGALIGAGAWIVSRLG